MEQSAGYRIYRRAPDAVDFELVLNPDDNTSVMTIPRSETFPEGNSQVDPARPVRYRFQDAQAQPGGLGPGVYQYKIACFDLLTGLEGPVSSAISVTVPASSETGAPWLTLSAMPLEGSAPLQVQLSAAGSYDPDGGALDYQWDWTGDGVYEYFSGADPTGYYTYDAPGTYNPVLKATDDEGLATLIRVAVLANNGEWVHTWGGVHDEKAVAIAIDSQRNVYVAANLYSEEDGKDAGVISYTPEGNLRWVKTFGDLDIENQHEEAVDIIISVKDEIVLLTKSTWEIRLAMIPFNISNLHLLSLDTNGHLIWQRCWRLDGGSFDRAHPKHLVGDKDSNIYLNGICDNVINSGNSINVIQKYNNSGDLLRTRNSPLRPELMRFHNNQLYICGTVPGNMSSIYVDRMPVLLICDTECSVVSSTLLAFAGFSGGTAYPQALAFDNADNIIISGWGETENDVANLFTECINQDGSAVWGFTWKPAWAADIAGDITSSVAIDSTGNILTAVALNSKNDTSYSSLMMTDGSGNMRACRSYNVGGVNASLTALASSATEKLFLCGRAQSAGGSWSDSTVNITPECWSSTYDVSFEDCDSGVFFDETLEATTPVGVADIGGGIGDALIMANPKFDQVADIQPPQILNITPERVIFNELSSFRIMLTGGTPSSYSWDFGAEASPRYSPHPAPGVTFIKKGEHQCRLTVTNEAGSDTMQFIVLVEDQTNIPRWRDHVEVTNGTSCSADGARLSAAMVGGLPQIAYIYPYQQEGFYLRNELAHVSSASITGNQWNNRTVVTQGSGDGVSIIDANGKPAISNGKYYWLAIDQYGTSWMPPQQMCDGYNVTSMTLDRISQMPVLCYTDGYSMHYIPSSIMDGSAWNKSSCLNLVLLTKYRPGVLDVNGKPAVFLQYDLSGYWKGSLLYVLGDDYLGSSWSNFALIAEDMTIPENLQNVVDIIDSKPAICATTKGDDAGNSVQCMNLYLANDAEGGYWDDPIPICAKADCNVLKVINGKPIIVYTVGHITMSRQASDAAGTQWNEQPIMVDPVAYLVRYPVLLDLGGIPALAYCSYPEPYVSGNKEFKIMFAKLY